MSTSVRDTSIGSAVSLETLLKQPAEIVTAVLSWLGNGDLLNLRLCSKCLHSLVHDLAKALYGSYSGQLKQKHGPLLQLTVVGHEASLMSYLELRDRSSSIWKLAGVLGAHLASNLRLGDAADKANEAAICARKAALLQQQLYPHLFCLDNFLDDLRQALAQADEALASWDDETYVAATDLLLLDQQQMVGALCSDATTIIGVSAALQILLGVCKAKQLGPKAHSSVYPFASIKRIMLSRGLNQFAELLNESGTRQQANFDRAGEAVLKARQSVQRARHLPHLRRLDLDMHRPSTSACQRPVEIIEKFLKGQDIWKKAACTVLQREFAGEPAQYDNNIEAWILDKLTEPDESTMELGDWQSPLPG